MIKKIVYIVILIIFTGCGIAKQDNLTRMDDYIIYVSDNKKEIIFHDSKKIKYPKIIKYKQYMHFGDGILFYKLNDITRFLNIPKNKNARVYIQTNNNLIQRDLILSLDRFNNIEVSLENDFVDFTIQSFFVANNTLTLQIYKKDSMLKEYKNINIKNLENKINNNIYLTIEVNNIQYKIKQDTIYKNEFEKTINDEKVSAQPLSFQIANNYCKNNEHAILPKLYVFEKARRLGYLKPPIGVSKEFISGYLVNNINEKDKIPEDEMSIIVFDWSSGKYFSYSKEFKNDIDKFKNISFRCMKRE